MNRSTSSLALGICPVELEKPLREEQPPFMLDQVGAMAFERDEVMRIAERGHELDDQGSQPGVKRQRTVSSLEKKPRRTLEAAETPARQGVGHTRQRRMDASSTYKALSAAPAARKPSATVANRAITSSSRSASAVDFVRLAVSPTTPSSLSASASARSLSASSAREREPLPIAAYLIPRIEEHTPPKGGNWDDVVLPAVAKKMGLAGNVDGQDDVDVWGRRRAGEKTQRPSMQGQDDASGYGDLLDSYQDDNGDNAASQPTSSRRLSDGELKLVASTRSVLNPSTIGSRPSLPHQESTETSRSIRSLGRKASLLIRNQPSQHSIHMQQIRRLQPFISSHQSLAQLDIQSLAKNGEEGGQPRPKAFDFPDPVKESGKEERDGHGKGCHCIIM